MRPRLLDLFCGAGGAAMGYHRAGFDVVGVDIRPQPNYPFEFHQADALDWLRWLIDGPFIAGCNEHGERWVTLGEFDAIHASPPCQRFSRTQRLRGREHPDLLDATRALVCATGLPYVIENVPEAPLERTIVLCGTMFGLQVDGFELRRHRVFEASFAVLTPQCRHELPAAPVFGHGPNQWFRKKYGRGFANELRRQIMQTPWIAWDEIGEAVPPAFTEHIGRYLLSAIRAQERAA